MPHLYSHYTKNLNETEQDNTHTTHTDTHTAAACARVSVTGCVCSTHGNYLNKRLAIYFGYSSRIYVTDNNDIGFRSPRLRK